MSIESIGAPGNTGSGDHVDDSVTSSIPTVNEDPIERRVDGFDVLFSDESEDWPEHPTARGFRAPWPVSILLALLLALGGLWLGALLQRGQSSTSATGSSSLSGLFGSLGAPSGARTGSASGFPSTLAPATSGTVTDITGSTLYVTNASGALVAVKISATTTINRNAKSSLSALKPGDTVTVQGTTKKNGSVAATTISASAQGVASTGFAGAGGFTGGPGGTTGASSGG